MITWLGSVTGLKHPTPSLGQHVTSLTPGSAFGVSSFPEPAVHKIQHGQASVPLPRLVRPSRLVVAPRNGDEQLDHRPRQRAARQPAAGHASRRRPAARSYWGTSKLVEAVVCPADPDGLARELMQSVDSWACRWCGELIARSPCPLCGHRARPRRRRPRRASTGRAEVGRRLAARRRVLRVDHAPRRARSSAARRTSCTPESVIRAGDSSMPPLAHVGWQVSIRSSPEPAAPSAPQRVQCSALQRQIATRSRATRGSIATVPREVDDADRARRRAPARPRRSAARSRGAGATAARARGTASAGP